MVKVGIVGATGYAGEELIRILLHHPQVEITSLTAKIERDTPIGEIFPQFRGSLRLICQDFRGPEEILPEAEVFFLALPHSVSMKVVPYLVEGGKKVIDLSADYRFKKAKVYQETYGVRHASPHLLSEAVYGLPELYRREIKSARLIANPGCYPTAALLGLAPLIQKDMVTIGSIIVDAKSGVSGAGRTASLPLHFPEVNENFKAYKVASHRHQPEMEEVLGELRGKEVKILFVPHLLPLNRGILSTIYVKQKEDDPLDKRRAGRERKTTDILEMYQEFYQSEPFIRILPEGEFPQTRNVRGTNFCEIGIKVEGEHIIVITAIDNLTKGASGQAVQNLNIMRGWKESLGLEDLPVLP